ncbi:MAG: hypothetical protein A2Y21_10540 [Clostridiales bacterium GWC2_40_7]|nr:MAG: hypothetical protein A2Y21_10540 [Clostridiales bacterium GWC2_40_7]
MNKAYCIYRIDDVTPGMNWDNFNRFLNLFGKYNVVPLIGVVPDNRDPHLTVGRLEESFWKIIKKLKDEGRVEVCQHGYRHIYTTDKIQYFYKLCGFKPQSEFSGVSFKKQFEMIRAGKEIFKKHGIDVDIWMAPGHSFDKNTIRALKKLEFKALTDGIGLFPVKKHGITLVPQQSWEPGKARIGIKTVCLHLNSAGDLLYKKAEKHLRSDPMVVPFSTVLHFESSSGHRFLNCLYKLVFIMKLLTNLMRGLVRDCLEAKY